MVESPDFLRDPVSRRTFLARMSAAGLGTAAAALIAGCGGGSNNNGGGSAGTSGLTTFADQTNFPGIPGASIDFVVLNYALTLETLEADLYRQALNLAAGKAASATPADGGASYTLAPAGGLGGLDPNLAQVGFLYLQQYAGVEAAHRDFLRGAISANGGTPVPANPKGYTTTLPASANLAAILGVIRLAEETGVTAYLGAAGFLKNPTFVQIASSIYTTEARHSAGINYILGKPTGPTGDIGGAQPLADPLSGNDPGEFEFAQTPRTVLASVQPFFIQ